MMIFETTSGTKYKLRNVEANATGYVGELVRLEWRKVSFYRMPTIGESFQYWHERWMGCVSTPVKAFLKDQLMHKYHYGYLGRDVWAAYCPCGWSHKQKVDADAKRDLFVAFIEHLEPTVEDDPDDEVL